MVAQLSLQHICVACNKSPDPLRGLALVIAHFLNGISRVSKETGKESKRIRHGDGGGKRTSGKWNVTREH